MKKSLVSVLALTAALFLGFGVAQADEKKVKVKCPVSGSPVNKAKFVEFNGGKVYFCCGRCPGAFKKNTKKFAAKANHQLVVTKQAKQVKCPFSGRALNPETKIAVMGANVCFCCNNCKGRAMRTPDNEKVNLLFNMRAFEKGFQVGSEKE